MNRVLIPVATLIIGILLLILWYMISILEVFARDSEETQQQINDIVSPIVYIGWANIATTFVFVILGGWAYVAGRERIRRINSLLEKWVYLCLAGSIYGLYLASTVVFVVCGC